MGYIFSKDVNCPYCKHPQDINHDDGYGYSEDETHKQQCGKCSKEFVFTTYISYSYTVHKADCLNGSDHQWEPTITVPKEVTKMRCTMCDEERKPTPEELKLVLETKN